MPYERIEDYGLIGNMRTAALVSRCGSIDWMCYPRFDSPSVFAALVDDAKGGRFRLGPSAPDVTYKQMYLPDTNVLITRFLSEAGVGEVEDYMPVRPGLAEEDNQLVRRVKVMRGSVPLTLLCEPALDYARATPKTTVSAEGALFEGPEGPFFLSSPVPLQRTEKGVAARFTLTEGDNVTFTFKRLFDGKPKPTSPEESQSLFEETVRYWRQWLSQSTYRGRWRESVNRSALALKLLTYEPTGALVASPTCGLPEVVGGERNWDYRYTWIRDSAFTLYALLRIGFKDEAMGFLSWLKTYALKAPGDSLQVAYGIDGRRDLSETELSHLEGYKGSRPVRLGNAAHSQLQLDIYGELMDAVYLYNKHATPISSELWMRLRSLVNWVCDHWQEKDRGVWETRGEPQHFVYSKLMCWVAVDRAIRLADKRSFPADRLRWLAVRDEIYEQVLKEGWNEERKAFTQFYGSDALDSSCLIMPLVFFMSPADPKMLSTLDAIASPARKHGLLSDGLLYRYDPGAATDGLGGNEGTFNMCTFWMVEAMTRAGRTDRNRLERARLLFERVLGYANHVGLYSEQIGRSGEALGNFPQAFAHLALISSAYNLDRALDGA